jgi:DNA-binding MarR family transcriptional regulator
MQGQAFIMERMTVAIQPWSHGCTCSKLRRLTRRVTAVYDRELAAAGLRLTQFSLLATLQREVEAEIVLTDFADRMDMDRSTLTRNLKPLVQRGWVEVVAAGHDGRMRLARITIEGEEVLRLGAPHWSRAQHVVNQTLGTHTSAQLNQWLDAVIPAFRPAERDRT